jgi:phosphoribosylaminoimidazole-succinocarboxamide synthase
MIHSSHNACLFQYVRDYLESINFDKTNPVALPDNVVERTLGKYLEIYEILTGKALQ